MKLAVLAALAVLFAFPAHANPRCADTADVISILTQKYGEQRAAIGMTESGVLFELWGNAETGSWTLVAALSVGQSCILEEGVEYQALPVTPPGEAL